MPKTAKRDASTDNLLLEEMVEMIDEPNRSACRKILGENRDLFRQVQGSSFNHQNWPGGYHDHVREVLNVAIHLYWTLGRLRPLPFSLSDALLVLFLHDIEKPWKYRIKPNGELDYIGSMKSKPVSRAFRDRKMAEYGIALTADQHNAMLYCEGELDDYSNRHRVMGPLAAFCHLCDVTSARIWFDCPKADSDPWPGARRITKAK